MDPLSLLRWTADQLASGPGAIAVVLRVEGSVPRRPGAMLAVGEGGARGTVGGGALEARVLEAAEAVRRGGEDRTIAIDLGGSPREVRDGICGGRMWVGVRRLDSASAAAAVAEAAARLAAGDPAVIVAADAGSWAAVASAASSAGREVRLDLDALEHGGRWRLHLPPRPVLLVVGAGHCGTALAAAATPLGYDVRLHDDRPEARHLAAAVPGVVVDEGSIAEAVASIGPRRELLVAIVTRSFAHDLEALEAVRGRPVDFLGLMGSRRRLGTVMGMLRDRGWTPQDLARLQTPIGIDIAAETPEEIAVSILAAIIRHRATAASGAASPRS
jgi:xanthine dehydrogenase accessory factor